MNTQPTHNKYVLPLLFSVFVFSVLTFVVATQLYNNTQTLNSDASERGGERGNLFNRLKTDNTTTSPVSPNLAANEMMNVTCDGSIIAAKQTSATTLSVLCGDLTNSNNHGDATMSGTPKPSRMPEPSESPRPSRNPSLSPKPSEHPSESPEPSESPRPSRIPSGTPSAQTGEVTLMMAAQNGSGQVGAVKLKQISTTEVRVDVDVQSIGTVAQPAHIHTGTCASPGGVVYPLNNVVSGKSRTVITANLATLMTNKNIINIHKSATEATVYTSCGTIQ